MSYSLFRSPNHKYWRLYQCQSQKSMTHKFTNAQILIKLINGNHENWWNTNSRNHLKKSRNHKGGEAYHKREHKAHQHVYHKRNANSMVANHHKLSRSSTNGPKTMGCYPTKLSRNSTKRGLVSLADKETSHIASLNHKDDRHDQREVSITLS